MRRGHGASIRGETETDHRAEGQMASFLVANRTDMMNNKTTLFILSHWPVLAIWCGGHRIRRDVCSWGDLSRGQFCAQCPKSQKCPYAFWSNKADPKRIYEQLHKDRHKGVFTG